MSLDKSLLLEFHKVVEGFSNKAYRDSGGLLTIGIGHANQSTEPFKEGDVWSDQKVLEVWNKDINEAWELTEQSLKGLDLPDGWAVAVFDIIFNTGSIPKTCIKFLKAKDYDRARYSLLSWIHCNKVVLLGLVKRRVATYVMTLGGDWRAVLDTPLSSKNLKDFNKLISKYDLTIRRTNDVRKFIIE